MNLEKSIELSKLRIENIKDFINRMENKFDNFENEKIELEIVIKNEKESLKIMEKMLHEKIIKEIKNESIDKTIDRFKNL
jgi:RNase H-fold protein (predicted Holliday junction resolvase)